jgi:hypothetical protein
MTPRAERLATLLLVLAAACTTLPRPRTPHAPTRHVLVIGEEADTLGESDRQDGEVLRVHTHDGRTLWVRAGDVADVRLVPGTWLLVRRVDGVASASVTRALDDFVEVSLPEGSVIVPAADVLAVLHHAPVAPTTPDVEAVTPPTSPPAPLSSLVAFDTVHPMRAGVVEDCEDGAAHLAMRDGSSLTAPVGDLHALSVEAGAHVTAMWNGSPYPATIVATRSGLVRLRWDDGSEEWRDRRDVVSVEVESVGAPLRGCPRGAVLVDEGALIHVGRLLACDAGHATVLVQGGATETRDAETLVRAPLRVGDPISALWSGSPYDATIVSLGERVHVRWYDGSEGDVDPADVVSFRAHEARPSEPAMCPPG